MAIFYHGTSANNARSILKSGLIPKAGKGGDVWAETHFDVRPESSFARNHSVYITPYLPSAVNFAAIAAQINRSKPEILEVHLPDWAVDSLVVDEEAHEHGYRFEGAIPARLIKPVPEELYSGIGIDPFYAT